MKKIITIFKKVYKFTKAYLFEYIKSMLIFVFLGIIGSIILWYAQFSLIFAYLAMFITVPAFCYSFWKGYVTTYALNYAAHDFIEKKEIHQFKDYVKLAHDNEKELIKFVGFVAAITIIAYIPSMVYAIKNIPPEGFLNIFIDFNKIADYKTVLIYLTITTILLCPFMNFSLQALFYKNKENYFNLLINCYKLGLGGFILSVIIFALTLTLGSAAPIAYIILILPLNLIIYSINMYWYYSKLKTGIID